MNTVAATPMPNNVYHTMIGAPESRATVYSHPPKVQPKNQAMAIGRNA